MKKFTAILSMALIICLLAGCAGTPVVYYSNCTCPTGSHDTPAADPTEAPAVDAPATEAPATEAPAPVEGAVKTGLAMITTVGESVSASADAEGEAKYDVTLVAVNVDDNGVITSCVIDSIGTSIKFDANGAITSDLTAAIATKNELGEAYGMKAYAGAKYEWNEQAANFCTYIIGKTIEEVKSISVTETTKPAEGTDLASSVTISIGGFISGVEAAVANAQHLGAQAGDKLILSSLSGMGDSTAADAENAGNAQLNVDAVAMTMNGDTITSAVIDSVQAKVAFDATGAITSDITAPVATKNQLGEGYGMKAWGGATYEWNEQSVNFCAYITGKTPADVASISITETTKPAEGTDLASSVTISIGGFLALIAKAAQ